MSPAFWPWSLAFYKGQGVSEALIALQDRDGLDVNLLLLCLYRAERREWLSEEGVQAALALTRTWSGELTQPIRAVRRRMKSISLGAQAEREALRAKLQAIELEFEAFHQGLLETLPPGGQGAPGTPVAALARENLERYGAALSLTPEARLALSRCSDWALLVSRLHAD